MELEAFLAGIRITIIHFVLREDKLDLATTGMVELTDHSIARLSRMLVEHSPIVVLKTIGDNTMVLLPIFTIATATFWNILKIWMTD